jgi:hypothetical protein
MATTAVDVKELPNSYVFVADMPGLKHTEIKVLMLFNAFPCPKIFNKSPLKLIVTNFYFNVSVFSAKYFVITCLVEHPGPCIFSQSVCKKPG